MSEAAPEAPRPAPPAGGNFLTRKYGPLPGWGWAALGVLGGGAFLWWRSHKAASSASATAPAGTTTDPGQVDTGPSIAAIQSEIQQLQGAASTDAKEDTALGKTEKADAAKEARTQASLTREEKIDAGERKQLDRLQRKEAAERKKPARRRSPAVHGGSGERRRRK